MRYVHSFQEAGYKRKLSKLIVPLVVKNAHPMMQDDDAPANTSIKLAMSRWLLEDVRFLPCARTLTKKVNFELRRRVPHPGDGILFG